MKNVVALFDRHEDASQAVSELVRNGFERENISLLANDATGEFGKQLGTTSGKQDTVADGAASGAGVGAVLGGLGGLLVGLGALAIPGIGPVLAAGPLMAALAGAGIGAAAGGLVGALVDLGIPDEDADVYAESIRRGGTLLVALVADERADRAAAILNQFHPVDIKERGTQYRSQNWQGFNAQEKPYDAQQINQMRVPIVDEELQVGKREVAKDRMRVHTYITEENVSKDVNLRHERVDVERRPVDRPASSDMLDQFEEGVIEIEQVDEEPVIGKQARVTEEVYINKNVDEEQRTVQGTERHTHVDVNKIDPKDMQRFDADFRKHFDTTYSSTGRDYNQFRDAYFYGYQKGADQRFSNHSWEQALPIIRQDWERESPQMRWEEYRDAVGEGYRRSRMNM